MKHGGGAFPADVNDSEIFAALAAALASQASAQILQGDIGSFLVDDIHQRQRLHTPARNAQAVYLKAVDEVGEFLHGTG